MLFKHGVVVTGEYFYDRKKMKTRVKSFLLKNQSFMLKAPRAYGKTSLIKQVLLENKIDYLYADFRKIPRLEKFNDSLIQYAYEKMGINDALTKIKDNVVSFMREHKTSITIDIELFEATVELFTNPISQEQRLINALDTINNVAKALNITLYIFMDEFQDIKNLSTNGNILTIMNTVMKQHQNVCYIFAGTDITEIFENKKSSFYNFCRKIKLESFDIQKLFPELKKQFKTLKISFETDEVLLNILERLKGHPSNTMMVMERLESIAEEYKPFILTEEHTNQAFEKALEECGDLIGAYIKEIKTKEHLHDVLYRMANDEKQVLTSASLLQKRKVLITMGYIEHVDKGEYSIIDVFLEEELRRS